MQAVDIMTEDPVTVRRDTPVKDIANVLLERGISAVPVLDDNDRLVGVVSEGDLIRRPEIGTNRRSSWWLRLLRAGDRRAKFDDYLRSHGRTAADVMSARVISVAGNTPLGEVAELLERNRIKRVPVVSEGAVVGIVSRSNLVQALAAAKAYTPEVPNDDRSLRRQVLTAVRQAEVDTRWMNVIVVNGRVEVWGVVNSDQERRALELAVESAVDRGRVDFRVGLMGSRLRETNWTV